MVCGWLPRESVQQPLMLHYTHCLQVLTRMWHRAAWSTVSPAQMLHYASSTSTSSRPWLQLAPALAAPVALMHPARQRLWGGARSLCGARAGCQAASAHWEGEEGSCSLIQAQIVICGVTIYCVMQLGQVMLDSWCSVG